MSSQSKFAKENFLCSVCVYTTLSLQKKNECPDNLVRNDNLYIQYMVYMYTRFNNSVP